MPCSLAAPWGPLDALGRGPRTTENIPLFERGAKVRFGVFGTHKIRASSRPWAGGYDLMPKPRWCGVSPPITCAFDEVRETEVLESFEERPVFRASERGRISIHVSKTSKYVYVYVQFTQDPEAESPWLSLASPPMTCFGTGATRCTSTMPGSSDRYPLTLGLAPDIPFGTAELPDGSIATGGMILYGGPIGSPVFVRKFIRAAIDKASLGLNRLSYMDSYQHRLIMLRMSFCKRVQHIQRLVPTYEHLHLLRPYDELLTRAVSDLTLGKGTFHELAGQLLHLPAPLGGLGVDSVAARADATFYSSFLTASIRLAALDSSWFTNPNPNPNPSSSGLSRSTFRPNGRAPNSL